MKYTLKPLELNWKRLHSADEGETFILVGNVICDSSNVYIRLDYASSYVLQIQKDFIAVVRLSDGKFETLPFETKIVHVSPKTPIEFEIK